MKNEKKYYERVTVEESAKKGVFFITTGKADITEEKTKLELINEHLKEVQSSVFSFFVLKKVNSISRKEEYLTHTDWDKHYWNQKIEKAFKFSDKEVILKNTELVYPTLLKSDILEITELIVFQKSTTKIERKK